MLYYIDAIQRDDERGIAQVVLLSAQTDEDDGGILIEIPFIQLKMANGHEISEASYVEYNNGGNEGIIFSPGGNSPFARRQIQRFVNYRKRLISNEQRPELLNPENFRQGAVVKSYHVNVGHGNCSIIVTQNGGFYNIWMVDCSVKEIRGRQYANNLEHCFDQIAIDLNINKNNIRITHFLLTHSHYDHYNGIEYLFNNGYIQNGAVFYMNLWYKAPSPTMNRILMHIINNHCSVIEPIRQNIINIPIGILYPECRIYDKKPSSNPGIPFRHVTKTNNSSVVYFLSIGDRSMFMPGDLERVGFDHMTTNHYCQPQLYRSEYYCISHHGSITGHINIPCLGTRRFNNVYDCKCRRLRRAILMGRDGAFSGIYSPQVINDFARWLVYTEKDNNGNPIHFFVLDWQTDIVTYY